MNKIISILFVLLNSIMISYAQDIEEWAISKKSIIYEKIYLHTDRHLYAPGDYIWFKAYLVRGLTHKPMPGYKNIYVQMISDDGKVFNERIILTQDGVGFGDIFLSDTIPEGYYTLRAFTRYLENFDEESYFHKRIYVSGSNNSVPFRKDTTGVVPEIEVTFLPESGNLVMNAINYVAFKCTDNSGRAIYISGSVVDENDSLVCNFSTLYKGMGKFMFMPVNGKTYRVKLDGYPEYEYSFNGIQEDGVNLHYTTENSDMVITLNRNFLKTDTVSYFLIGEHKGINLFYEPVQIESFNKSLKLEREIFPIGISKLMLVDHSLEPIAERLIFNLDTLSNEVSVIPNKTEFTTREKVEVEIELPLNEFDSVMSSFSLAVVNRNYLSGFEPGQSLVSHLLLDSELKGFIESPASYFTDSEDITKSEKIDLLMMVNGWRSYYWDYLTEKQTSDLKGWDDAGITIEGYVRGLLRNRPVINGEVIIGPFSGNLLYESTRTDENGRFRFDRLYLRNMEKIFIHARNSKDRLNTEIILDPIRTFDSKPMNFGDKILMPELIIPGSFYNENVFRQLKINEYYPGMKNIMLDEINVVGKNKINEDGHFRIYPEADKVLKVADDDYTYTNVLDYLGSKSSGVIVSGDHISIRGGGMPMILVDGVNAFDEASVENALKRLPLSEIDKIEILNDPAKLAAFGSSGGNGVIAIYTRRGDGRYEINKFVKGRIGFQVKGFRKPVQFYSPKYTPENINHSAPDFRPTLYWNPELEISKRKSAISFYTSDELGNYVLILEGISRSGKLFSVFSDFSVTGYHNR